MQLDRQPILDALQLGFGNNGRRMHYYAPAPFRVERQIMRLGLVWGEMGVEDLVSHGKAPAISLAGVRGYSS